MKIDRIYQDTNGTTWVYATCEHTPVYKRTYHRKRRTMFPTWYKILTLLSVLIVTWFIIGNATASNKPYVKPEESTSYEQDITRIVENDLAGEAIESFVTEEIIESDPVMESIDELSAEPDIEGCIGQATFTIGSASFTSLDLPNVYYGDIDFSSFQPYEDYSMITNPKSAAYAVTRSDLAYNDENGLRRYTVSEDQFSIDGKDDYVIALGTFYKPKGTCGQRYLIVTTTGSYTAIAGDEKADQHTEDMNMFTWHRNGKTAGIIEWIVDMDTLDRSMRRSGNIATPKGPVEELKGDILYIYLIEE